MNQTSVEDKVCRACGADIRSQALFCYNCGSSIAVRNLSFSDNGSSTIAQSQKYDGKTIVETTEEKQTVGEEIRVRKKSENLEKPNVQDKTKLKSAAALRRKSKSLQPKTVEVVWEEHENAPNIWFLTVAIALTILVVAILLLATYFK